MSTTLSHVFSQLRRVILGLAMVSCCYSAWAQQIENPITCDEPTEPLEVEYGMHSIGCGIDPAADLDQFSFFGSQGDLVRIIVLSSTAGFDPRVELRNTQGNVVEDTSCDGRSGVFVEICSVAVERSLQETGTFFFAVSDLGSNEAGAYTVQLERLSPKIGLPDQVYNEVTVDAIDPQTDMDFLSFEGVANTQIRVTALSMMPGFDPRIEVSAPDGTVLADAFCDGRSGVFVQICSLNIDQTLTQSGTYSIRISDQGSNESGGYEVGLQCLFGPCPAAADLGLTMSDSPDPVASGSDLDYSLTVTNNGPGDAQAVVVTTLLPEEVAFDFTTGCNEDPNGVPNCSLGELPNGQLTQFLVRVTVDGAAQGTITNVAVVDALTSEGSAGDETATEDTLVLSGDLIFRDGFE